MSMKKPVYRETVLVAVGEVVGVALMLGVFALAGYGNRAAVLGGILGGILAICNFFFMAVGTSLAADRAERQNVKGGTVLVRLSFLLRYLVLFLILIAAAKSKLFHLLALVLPLIFVHPILMLGEFFRKSRDSKS